MVQNWGKTEPEIGKNWNGQSTVALSFYFWQFCSGELVVELLMLRSKKTLKSVIAETFSSLTPKKAKKPENVIKYYCIIEYTHMSLNLKGQPM